MEAIAGQTRGGLGNFVRAVTVTPINDLKGAKSGRFSEGEELLRCKLAASYRLVDILGWTHGIFNHISLRCSEAQGNSAHHHFLINPFGLLYSEITASSLLKVDLKGKIVDQGSSEFGFNNAGFTLHSAIHGAFPQINCVVHLHTPAAVAVSSMKCGLLPLGQESLLCGSVGYHDYNGILIDDKEKELLVKNLGSKNKILILRNHGFAACGETVEEAFYLVSNFLAACEAQVRAVALGLDNIFISSKESRRQVSQDGGRGTSSAKKNTGEIEFEAMMRALDNLGYRTGYKYKLLPTVKSGQIE
jgi:adducin